MDAVIDFKAYGLDVLDTSQVTEETLKGLGKRIVDTFQTFNFCYLKNHGVKEALLEEFEQVSRNFFELPDNVKSKFPMGKDYRFGCAFLETEHLNLKRSAGDLHEAFNYSPPYDTEWPPVENFEAATKKFYAAARGLALRVCDVVSLGLDQPIDFLRNAHHLVGQKGNTSASRATYYPPIPADMIVKPDQARAGEHIDGDTLSFDFQDATGGIDIQTPNGEWIPADPIPGTVLVVVGPILQRWTADRLTATKHRILLTNDERRFKTRQASLFFLHPDDDHVIRCMDGSDKYEPITGRGFWDKWSEPIYELRK